MKRILVLLALTLSLLSPAAKTIVFQEGDRVRIPFRCAKVIDAYFVANFAAVISPVYGARNGSLILTRSLEKRECVAAEEPHPFFTLVKQMQAFGNADTQGGFVWGVARREGGQIVGYIGLFERPVPE